MIVSENAVNSAIGVNVREGRMGMEDWEREKSGDELERGPENTFKFLTK